MKTFVYTINLKNDPDTIKSYKEYHNSVWPEVEQALRSVGIINMRIYILGTRMVNVIETVDHFEPDRDLVRYTQNNPKVEEWDKMMAQFQQKIPEAREGEWWALMEKVYELNR